MSKSPVGSVLSAEAQPIDKEAVKTLAIAIGVRNAARKLGLSEDRVRQWSKREGWLKQPDPTPQPPTVTQNNVTSVTKPSEVIAQALTDDSNATRIGFSKAARKVAERLPEMEEGQLLDKDTAQAAKHWHGVASGTHGWQEKQQEANVVVNVALLGVNPSE